MVERRVETCNRPWQRRLLARTALSGLPLALGGALGLALLPGTALALPQDGVVVAGTAAIAQTGAANMQINQSSLAAVIDWQSFDIGASETVEVFQPSAMATLLNRVIGGGASNILGQLSATGRLTLINPSGITIGHGARIDVSGLIATSANIGNSDFMAGNQSFATPGLAGARISNAGEITARDGGLVALVGPSVANSGAINARLGRVALAGAERFTLDLYGDDLIHIGVDDAVMSAIAGDALVANSGAISADGGVIQITARGGAAAIESAINMSGVVQARSVGMENGEVVFYGHDQGIVQVSGTVDTSGRGAGESGGTIRVLGDKVALLGDAMLDASGDAGGGDILVGGAFQGGGDTPTATRTFVGRNTNIVTDAISSGDAGTAIVWADGDTRYYGTISARGGALSGDGGLVEVSGKQDLGFDGTVDTSAANGTGGSLLLDPNAIVITNDGPAADDAQVSDGAILFADGGAATFTISENALEALTGSLTLQANVSITINDLVGSLSPDNELNLTGLSGDILIQAGAGGFTMNAGDTIKVDTLLQIGSSGAISLGSLSSTDDIGIGLQGLTITFNGVSTMTAGMTANGTDGITVNANLTANGSGFTFSADGAPAVVSPPVAAVPADGVGTFTIANGVTVSAPNGAMLITAADVNLNTSGALNSGSATAGIGFIQSMGQNIGLGATAGSMTLSDSELDRIASVFGAGFTTTGNMTVDGVSNSSLIGGAQLNANQITFQNNASTFTALDARAENGLTLNEDLTLTSASLGVILDSDFSDNSNGAMTIAADVIITANSGIILRANKNGAGDITASGAVSLLADNGVSIEDNFAANGTVTINADKEGNGGVTSGLSILNNSTLSSNGSLIDITLNGILLTGSFTHPTFGVITGNGFINADASTVSFSHARGGEIRLGGAEVLGPETLDFDNTELARITAGNTTFFTQGTLASFTGGIIVNGLAVTDTDNLGAVRLESNSAISFIGAASSFQSLEATAQTGIIVDVNIETLQGNLSLDGDFGDLSGGGISFADGVVLAAVQDLQLSADFDNTGGVFGTNDLWAAGSLTLRAGGVDTGVVLNDTLHMGGDLFVFADTDGNGVGGFSLIGSQSVLTSGNNASISAADFDIAGIIDAGAGLVSFTYFTPFGLPELTVGGDGLFQYIDSLEISRITADSVQITSNTSIVVEAISAINSQNIAGLVLTMEGTGLGMAITFTEAGTFRQLEASSAQNLIFNANVTVTESGFLLVADSDANGDGNFSVSSGVTLSAVGLGADITTSDFEIGGLINAAGAQVSITNHSGNIVLSPAFLTADMEISNADLAGIVADVLSISSSGTLTVDGVQAVSTADIATLNLFTTGVGDIIFSGASSFITGNVVAVPGASGAISIGADLSAGSFAFNGIVEIAGVRSVNGATGVTFAQTVDGVGESHSLSVTSSGGNVVFGDPIGNVHPLHALTATGLNVFVENATTNGPQSYTATDGSVFLTGAFTLGAGDFTVTGPATLFGATTINASNGAVSMDTVNGFFNLSITALNDIDVGPLGDTVALNNVILFSPGNTIASFGSPLFVNATSLAVTAGSVALDGDGFINSSALTRANVTFNDILNNPNPSLIITSEVVSNGTILIINGASGTGANDNLLDDGIILFADGAATNLTISSGKLESLTGGLLLQATNMISLSDLSDNVLNLNNLTAAVTFTIGNPTDADGGVGFTMNAGDTIQLDQNFTVTANGGSISLGTLSSTNDVILTGNQITLGGASTVGLLRAFAENGVIVNANLSTTTGDLQLEGDVSNNSGGGITFDSGVILTSNNFIELFADNSGTSNVSSVSDLWALGALTLNARDGIGSGGDGAVLVDTLHMGGALAINADNDSDGDGDFFISANQTLLTNGFDADIRAANFDILGSINAGLGEVNLTFSTPNVAGVGGSGFDGPEISADELGRITTSFLRISGGDFFVGAVSALQSANIAELSISAGPTSGVTFHSGASTFRSLRVEAGTGITALVNITATEGGLSFDADIDNAGDGVFTVGGELGATLSAASGDIDITAADVELLSGSILNAAVSVSITQSQGQSIGLGDVGGGGATGSGLLIDTDIDDYFFSTTATGLVTINATETVDDDSDFDVMINLYVDDGVLDIADFIDQDDDSGGGPSGLESLLSLSLNAGDYLLRVGTHGFSSDQIGATNAGGHHDGTDYTLSIEGPFVIGVTGGSGAAMHLSASELQNITALETSFITSSDIIVAGVSGVDGMGAVLLQSGNQIHFLASESGGVEFAGLDAQAVEGIFVDVDLVATGGDLLLDGDSTDDSGGGLSFADGVTLTAFDDIELSADAGSTSNTQPFSDIFALGSLTLISDGDDVRIFDVLHGAGGESQVSITAFDEVEFGDDVFIDGGLDVATNGSDNGGVIFDGTSQIGGDLFIDVVDSVQFSDDLLVSGAVDITTDNGETGDVTFDSTVTIGGDLMIASSDTVVFNNDVSVDGNANITALDTEDDAVFFDTIAQFGGSLNIGAGSDVDFSGDLSVGQDLNVDSANGHIHFNGIVAVGGLAELNALTQIGIFAAFEAEALDAEVTGVAGSIDVQGNIGDETPLDFVSLTADTISLSDVTTNGIQSYDTGGDGTVFFNGTYITTGGAFTVDGNVNALPPSPSVITTGDGEGFGVVDISGAVSGQLVINGEALNPGIIFIIDGISGSGVDDAQIADGMILFADVAGVSFTISSGALEALTGSLTLQAPNMISLSDLSDNVLNLNNLSGAIAFNTSAGGDGFAMNGNDSIQFDTALAITTADGDIVLGGLTGGASSVTLAGNHISFSNNSSVGQLTVSALNGIDVHANLASTSGNMVLDADFDDDGDGDFALGEATVSATNGGITITAADVDLSGNLTASTFVSFFQSTDDSIGLGGSGAAMHLSASELQNITAQDTRFTTGDDITVNGVTGVAAMGGLSLTSGDDDITFQGGDSAFAALTATAGGGISVDSDLTVTGAVALTATDDVDFFGQLNLGNALTVTSSLGHIVFANNVHADGAVLLNAATRIDIGGGAGSGVLINDQIDDYFFSTTASGLVTINVTPQRVDDDEWDPEINLFFDDGSLDLEDFIDNDDDGGDDHASFMENTLATGDYRLRIGNYSFDDDIISETNPDFSATFTDYILSIEGPVTEVVGGSGFDELEFRVQSLMATVSGEGGTIAVKTNLGAETPLTFVILTANTVSLHDVTTNGLQRYDTGGDGTVIFNSTYTTNGGAFNVIGSVVANSPATINAGSGIITITGTITGQEVAQNGGSSGPSDEDEEAITNTDQVGDALIDRPSDLSEDDIDEDDDEVLEEESEEDSEEVEAEDPYLEVVEEEDLGESGDSQDDEGSAPGCACGT